jgi:AraC family transcriptional regulator, positive regulator of tynA and feaB
MESFKASSLPVRSRVTAWNELYSSQLERADLTPANRDGFDAALHLGNLGPLRVGRLCCNNSAIDRNASHIDQGARRAYTLVLQVRGNGTLAQYGNEVTLQEGDITLYDNAVPHSHMMSDSAELILVRVPAAQMREHLPTPERFCGLRLASSEGLTSAIAALISNLCRQLEAGLPTAIQERLAHQLLEMTSSAYAVAFDALLSSSPVVNGRHSRARLYIEQHLRDPDLGPRVVAAQLRVSSRYLRMIFAASRESVSTYILRRRLEECARQLADPRWRAHSISDIAFGWGFNSAPHFSRSFRELYGTSPREYRLRYIGEQGSRHAAVANAA